MVILSLYHLKNDHVIDFVFIGAHAKMQCLVLLKKKKFIRSNVQSLIKISCTLLGFDFETKQIPDYAKDLRMIKYLKT